MEPSERKRQINAARKDMMRYRANASRKRKRAAELRCEAQADDWCADTAKDLILSLGGKVKV